MIVGTRGSQLALAQTNQVCSDLSKIIGEKIDVEKSNTRKPRNQEKKYKITANFSRIITLIYDYLYKLVIESKSTKEKILDFILLLVSKELSYNEIKEEDELNSIKKPDYSTEHTGFKKRSMR